MAYRQARQVLRIVLWGIVAVVFTALFFTLARGGKVMGNWFGWQTGDMVILSDETYTQPIDSLEIDWTSGRVVVLPSTDESIRIVEKGLPDNDRRRLKTHISGNTLVISETIQPFFFLFNFGAWQLDLDVYLPQKVFERVRLNATSGTYDLKGLQAKQMQLELTSGNLYIDNVVADDLVMKLTSGRMMGTQMKGKKLDIDSTSGTVNVSGAFEDIRAKMTSGTVEVESTVVVTGLRGDMTSGNMTFTMPDNDGFNLSISKTSGRFDTDFAMTKNGDDRQTYKNGGPQYHLGLTSGRVSLYKR